MDSMTIVNRPNLISEHQNPAYVGCLPEMAATKPSAFQSQSTVREISDGLLTAMIAIPLSLSIGIVTSFKIGFATMVCAYVIGWSLSHSK